MEKPKLVFIHGMFCTSRVFDKLVQHFHSLGFECLAVTLPYHGAPIGATPHPKLGTTSLADYVVFLQENLAQLGERYILVGHSMGGLLTMKMAALPEINPEMIVLLAPAPPAGVWALEWSVIRSFWGMLGKWNFWKNPGSLTFEQISWAMLNQVPEQDRRAIYDILTYESGRAGFEMGFALMLKEQPSAVDYAQIGCPVTIFVGTEDRTTPYKVVAQIVGNLRQARNPQAIVPPKSFKKLIRRNLPTEVEQIKFIVKRGLGHWLVEELEPEEIASEILALLTK